MVAERFVQERGGSGGGPRTVENPRGAGAPACRDATLGSAGELRSPWPAESRLPAELPATLARLRTGPEACPTAALWWRWLGAAPTAPTARRAKSPGPR